MKCSSASGASRADLDGELGDAGVDAVGGEERYDLGRASAAERNIRDAERRDGAMTRYEILTEADARVIERGATVQLAAGGHVTPLALDTLRERRITVVRDDGRGDDTGLAPRMPVERLAVGSDHSGIALRRAIRDHLRGAGTGGAGGRARDARSGRLSRHRRRPSPGWSRAVRSMPAS